MPSENYVNYNVSPNFNYLTEMKCRCSANGKNYCNGGMIGAAVVERMEILRLCSSALVGRRTPVTVTSGVRCVLWNREQKSVDTSNHVKGDAVDSLTPKYLHLDEYYILAHHIQTSLGGGLGYYHLWRPLGGIHIDVGANKRWVQRTGGSVEIGYPTHLTQADLAHDTELGTLVDKVLFILAENPGWCCRDRIGTVYSLCGL